MYGIYYLYHLCVYMYIYYKYVSPRVIGRPQIGCEQ